MRSPCPLTAPPRAARRFVGGRGRAGRALLRRGSRSRGGTTGFAAPPLARLVGLAVAFVGPTRRSRDAPSQPARGHYPQIVARWEERYRDGEARLPDEPDERQRQLTRLGNVAWGAGLTALLEGRRDEAREWLDRAADRYRESYELAPPGSWGRPIAILKARLLAGRDAQAEAEWTLAEGAAASASPIGRYAACLALLVLGRWADARPVASSLRERDDFPSAVADALAAIAAEDVVAYAEAVEDVLLSFEARDEFLEDVPVADTVLVLQLLAAQRDLAADLGDSPLLPDL